MQPDYSKLMASDKVGAIHQTPDMTDRFARCLPLDSAVPPRALARMTSQSDRPEKDKVCREAFQTALRAEIIELQGQLAARDAEISALRAQVRRRPVDRFRDLCMGMYKVLRIRLLGRAQRARIRAIEASDLFDAEWYALQYPQCGGPRWAALHYLQHGARAGHDPGPEFDTAAYLAANPDVAAAQVPALAHYLMHGSTEGRRLRPERV